jgi:thiol-disulfide isomerase/thioredoxin
VNPHRWGRFTAVALSAVAVLVLVIAGCSSGADAVAQGGTFDFVSPGGKTDISYDPPQQRGTVGVISGPDLMTDGKTTAVSDFPGQVVVINMWGSWCAPCRTESPELEKVYLATKGLGVQFLGIDVRDTRDAARDFVIDAKVTYPSIFDPEIRTAIGLGRGYPTSVVPTTMVLDRQHRVAAVFLRALLAEDLQPVVARVAAEQ